MSIQQNVNQLLTLTGAFSQLAGKDIAEKSKWKNTWEKMQSAERATGVDYKHPKVDAKNLPAYEQSIITRQNMLNHGESQLVNNPSKFNLENQIKARGQLRNIENAVNEYKQSILPPSPTSEQVMSMMAEKGQRQVRQRRNWSDYRNRLEMLGGKIGDYNLPKETLKEIDAQYSKADRRKIMNSMDKMDKENK